MRVIRWFCRLRCILLCLFKFKPFLYRTGPVRTRRAPFDALSNIGFGRGFSVGELFGMNRGTNLNLSGGQLSRGSGLDVRFLLKRER